MNKDANKENIIIMMSIINNDSYIHCKLRSKNILVSLKYQQIDQFCVLW